MVQRYCCIAQQGRQQEFGALYNRLAQGVNTNKIMVNGPGDVKVHVVPPEQIKKKCSDDAATACAFVDTRIPTIYISPMNGKDMKTWESDLLHEVGHTLGLDEQYDHLESHNRNMSRTRASQERAYRGAMDK